MDTGNNLVMKASLLAGASVALANILGAEVWRFADV